MPFNLQVQDQVPAITMRGAENMSRGIEQFGAGIGRLLEGFAAKKEQQKNEAKMVRSLRQSLKDVDSTTASAEGREPNPHQFDLLGPDEVVGAWRAVGVKSALQDAAQRQKIGEQTLARGRREEEQYATAPGFYATLGRRAAGGPSNRELENYYENGGDMPPDRPFNAFVDVPAAAAESGHNPGNQFNDILNSMRKPEGWNLKPGDNIPLPGGSLRATSASQYQYVADKAEPITGPPKENYPWLYSDDEKEVKGALQKLEPSEMRRAVAARSAIKRMNGNPDPLQRLIDAMLSGEFGSPGGGGRAGKPTGAAAAPTMRFRKNPKTGEAEPY